MRIRYKSRETFARDPWLGTPMVAAIRRGEFDHWLEWLCQDVLLPEHEPHFGGPP